MRPRDIINKIGSLQLTLALLLALAIVSAVGTILPQGKDISPYRDLIGPWSAEAVRLMALNNLYHSSWFRALLVLLSVNLVACMSLRIPAVISAARGEAALKGEPFLTIPWSETAAGTVRERLRELGYRPRRQAPLEVFSRHGASLAASLVSHASLLLIMASATADSALGFVCTHRMYVGDTTASCFDWSLGGDRPLPFSVRAEDLVQIPSPVSLKLGLREVATDGKKGMLVTHVGGIVRVPGAEGTLRIESFDTGTKKFTASWEKGGTVSSYVEGDPLGSTGLALVTVAWASWPASWVFAPTSFLEEGAMAAAGDIAPNSPLRHRGIQTFLTDYGTDKGGFPFVGFQFVRDPARWGVWAGSCLFLAALTVSLFFRHRCVVLARDGDTLRIHLSARGDRRAAAAELVRAMPFGASPETGGTA